MNKRNIKSCPAPDDMNVDTYSYDEFCYQESSNADKDVIPSENEARNFMTKGISVYEEIYVEHGIKRIGDLELCDLALSYDFNKKEFCYKPIIRIGSIFKTDLYKVLFRNGQSVNVSINYTFWSRQTQQKSIYKKTNLQQIDLSRWWKRKIPIAKKIPYQIKDIRWLTEDLCIVIGHYLAEGWSEYGKVSSSGHDLPIKIIPILQKYSIPYSEYFNTAGVPCIRVLKSDFKDFLKKLKTNSFRIHLIEPIFHLPPNKLSKLINGFYIGDGHWGNYPDKRGFKSNKQEVLSTSSEQLARDFQRIGLQIGKTFHIWKQVDHQGFGTKPIYRITYNPNSHFLKNFGYPNVSEVSIREFTKIENGYLRNFSVAETNIFVFKNGIIGHSL